MSRVPDGGGQKELLWRYSRELTMEVVAQWMYGQMPLDPTNTDYRVSEIAADSVVWRESTYCTLYRTKVFTLAATRGHRTRLA